jgi:hypothetical protein
VGARIIQHRSIPSVEVGGILPLPDRSQDQSGNWLQLQSCEAKQIDSRFKRPRLTLRIEFQFILDGHTKGVLERFAVRARLVILLLSSASATNSAASSSVRPPACSWRSISSITRWV